MMDQPQDQPRDNDWMNRDYQPQDDYTDGDLALMNADGAWPRCVACGWSPDVSDKPHAQFVAQNTTCTSHDVQIDPADLSQ